MSTPMANVLKHVDLRSLPGRLVRSWQIDGVAWHLVLQPLSESGRQNDWQNFRLIRDVPRGNGRRVFQLGWSPDRDRLAKGYSHNALSKIAPDVRAGITAWLSSHWPELRETEFEINNRKQRA